VVSASSPGTIVASRLADLSAGFGVTTANFARYSQTYGTLARSSSCCRSVVAQFRCWCSFGAEVDRGPARERHNHRLNPPSVGMLRDHTLGTAKQKFLLWKGRRVSLPVARRPSASARPLAALCAPRTA